ncbi:daunorubicin resistance protein DrrA family ABC transporter ATP-binding protein [Actinosynnema sp. NPDC047251]|uniref:Daunorubicin/doxorubicin resistance ATP-binding protein DrrA n=1 Tax=Saccharothrix espanaensis (strain ATCC 51144 / DSM 44229 / JCM 9112 / NBRC 15066 / NRRL 15764) TaxID=1179773 RepID=K0JQN6_SACES|nr:daunorubicin resistance protein DrrA family ABC transporter ATP-binding protein [Saccharothrix espanaensis]CCH29740.1 Daunorubicin/doxorubicin resistance ATP-binding protein DrrA [Saccharothrix espanaensis DSM 44229]
MTYTVEAVGLRKSFRGHPVLKGLDLGVRRGEVFALLGPNGAGKTTTVRVLATLLRPDGGTARIAGHDVVAAPRRVRAAISLTGQYAAVDELLTGRENLAMMARLRRLDRRAARDRAAELLERFDLADAADRRASTYSGGMRRRLDLAASLVVRPEVLFLDEPTTGLDPRSRREVWAAVADLARSGVTVLLTTQYLEEADRLADRIAVLHGGDVVAEGTAAELKGRAGTATVELFLPDRAALAGAGAVLDGLPDVAKLSLRVPGDGSARHVREVLDLLHRRDVPVDRVELHRPTLDEVFLSLTGPEVRGAA